MPWKRGNKDTDTELANVQSWIEYADPIFFGKNGDVGMVRVFYDDKAATQQREKDIKGLIKFIGWIVGLPATGAFILSLLRAFHMVN